MDTKNKKSKITIVIDPGHGATYNKWNTVDPGALGSKGINEKDFTLLISANLGIVLENKYGYNVLYTRQSDVTSKQKHLKWRVDYAHNENADYFISIHLDSFAASKNRFSAYYWHKGNAHSKEGKKFAESVSNAVKPRGFTVSTVKSANHYVTRNTRVPAILVECGNIQNADTSKEVANKKFIEEFAQGVDAYIQGRDK